MALGSSEAQNPSQATVFVVDDDESLRRALARLIQSAGWNVETFESAREFLQRLPYAGTGCVVLDLQMPEMTGVELQGQMVAAGIILPIVFLTAHGDVPTATHAMKKGATDFLQKPVDDDVLLAAIRESIEQHRVQHADQQLRHEVEERLARLSPREREVLQFVVRGLLNKQIADRMGIALKTVKVHRARVMEKMEVDSVAALVHLCEVRGTSSSQEDN